MHWDAHNSPECFESLTESNLKAVKLVNFELGLTPSVILLPCRTSRLAKVSSCCRSLGRPWNWLRVFDRWNLSGDTAAAKEEVKNSPPGLPVPLLTVEFNNGNHWRSLKNLSNIRGIFLGGPVCCTGDIWDFEVLPAWKAFGGINHRVQFRAEGDVQGVKLGAERHGIGIFP